MCRGSGVKWLGEVPPLHMMLQDAGLELALQERSSGYGGSSQLISRAKRYENLHNAHSSPPPNTQKYENLHRTRSSPPPVTGTHDEATVSSPPFSLPPLDLTVKLKFYKVSIIVFVDTLAFHDCL
jgi:hypothetical protein